MLRMLCGYGGDTNDALQRAIGLQIRSVKVQDDRLRFTLQDGSELSIGDGGQSCCEHRYMTCDDDLNGFDGATFLSAETRDAPDFAESCDEAHEVQFLVIKTSKGDITAETHNEHNGYYGGFSIQATFSGGPQS